VVVESSRVVATCGWPGCGVMLTGRSRSTSTSTSTHYGAGEPEI
jgi:hypothetical protein